MPVGLLYGNGDLLLRDLVVFVELGLLVIRKILLQGRGIAHVFQSQSAAHLAFHVLNPVFLDNCKDHIVEVDARRPSRTLVPEQAADKVGNGHLRGRVGHCTCLIAHDCKHGLFGIVLYVLACCRKEDKTEEGVGAAEDVSNFVIQAAAYFLGLDLSLALMNELGQIWFDKKAQGRVWSVVEVGGLLPELAYGAVYEAYVRVRAEHGVAQFRFVGPLEVVVEGKGVEEDGSGHPGSVGRHVAVEVSVKAFGKRGCVSRGGSDISLQRRDKGLLPKAGHDFLTQGCVA